MTKNQQKTIKSIKEFEDLAHALFECKNDYWDAINLGKEAIKDLLKVQCKEIKEDLQSVINMLEGSTDRQKIINYIKEYLL